MPVPSTMSAISAGVRFADEPQGVLTEHLGGLIHVAADEVDPRLQRRQGLSRRTGGDEREIPAGGLASGDEFVVEQMGAPAAAPDGGEEQSCRGLSDWIFH